MLYRAYAKINLGLNVLSRREDGYHELEMVMVPVTFYDELFVEKSLYFSFSANREYVESNPDNTILKAYHYLKEKYGFKENYRIHVNKHIPTRAGLAGGSSDGAALIKAIDELADLKMSEEEKREACISVGSDVYFCLVNRPALVFGTGDIVKPFVNRLDPYILLVKPSRGVSTKMAFSELDLNRCDHPDVYKIKEALEEGDYQKLCQSIGNSLEESSFRIEKRIAKVKNELIEYGFDAALMSGSGSTVFAMTKDRELLLRACDHFKEQGYFTRRVQICAQVPLKPQGNRVK